jgi:PKD repeat protein
MNKSSLKRLGMKLALAAMLTLPELVSAQYFNYNSAGDVLLGFRKTGAFQGSYEFVVDAGNITNFLALPAGNSLNISNYAPAQLSDAFPDGYQDLQWSAFSAFGSGSDWVTSLGTFPASTAWYTRARTNAAAQSTAPARLRSGNNAYLTQQILSTGQGAVNSSTALVTTNVDNNTLLVREPITDTYNYLTAYIGDRTDPTLGDFGGTAFHYSVENTVPSSFTSAAVSDLYESSPLNTVDPLSGTTTGAAYFVGYFTFHTDGTMSFTRAAVAPPAPVAGFSGTPTAGFAPLQVGFTDASTGSITNWLWNFGDGQTVTNGTSASVNHTYAAGGTFTVALTVKGAGGSNTKTQTGYVVASSAPTIGSVTSSGGQLVFGGTNCPAGVQYRILTSTNLTLPLASWTPVATNTFPGNGSFSYTNLPAGRPAAYFRLVSP